MGKRRGTTTALVVSGAAAVALGAVLLLNPPEGGFGRRFGAYGAASAGAVERPWAYRGLPGRAHHGGIGIPAFLIGAGIYAFKPRKRDGGSERKED
jgi:hypothetical protein